MTPPHTTSTAATRLHQAWQEGTVLDALPGDLRPATRGEGYAIQAALERFSGFPLYGWKVAATSIAGQKHIGVDGPLAGRLFQERVFTSGADVPFDANRMAVAEIEFAFRLGRDLPPASLPRSVEDVLAAVETLHPSIEVPDSRFADFVTAGGPQLIADNACAHYFVEGQAYAGDWRGIDFASFRPRGIVKGRYEREGLGANVLGDPRIALTWLANELSGLGIPLKAGEIVTTGTCLVPLEIQRGDHVTGDFGILGTVSVQFT